MDGVDDSHLLLWAALLGLIPAAIGKRKGYGFFSWWIAGAVMFIIALPWAIFIKPNPAVYRTCPHCQSRISAKAAVCPHCAREVPPPPPEVADWRPTPRPPRDNANRPYYIFIAVCVVAAAGLFLWAMAA